MNNSLYISSKDTVQFCHVTIPALPFYPQKVNNLNWKQGLVLANKCSPEDGRSTSMFLVGRLTHFYTWNATSEPTIEIRQLPGQGTQG